MYLNRGFYEVYIALLPYQYGVALNRLHLSLSLTVNRMMIIYVFLVVIGMNVSLQEVFL